MSIDMDIVSVMAAYSACGVCVCVCVCVYFTVYDMPSYTVNYTHTPRAEYAAITLTMSMSMDMIEPFL